MDLITNQYDKGMPKKSQPQRKSPQRKLSPDAVLEMRKLQKEGAAYADLASQFGLSAQAAHSACTGKTYRDV